MTWSDRLLAANPGLARHPRAQLLADVAGAALDAVDTRTCVRRHVHLLAKPKGASVVVGEFLFDLGDDPLAPGKAENGQVWIFGAGKASERTAAALVELLGDRVVGGLVITKHRDPALADALGPVEVHLGDHPTPGPRTASACARLRELAREVRPRDLVLCPISGGASSLLSEPLLPGAEWSALIDHLLRHDVPIHPINWLRRRCDALKAGGLARAFAPATVVSLIISDVIGDELALIGSGPTVYATERELPLATVREDLGAPLERFLDRHSVTRAFLADPPPLPAVPVDPAAGLPQSVHHVLMARNGDAREAACRAAQAHGLASVVVLPALSGPAHEEGERLGQLLVDMPPDIPVRAPACIVTGGETTVDLGDTAGLGGRNQELALAAAFVLEAWQSAGTDDEIERAVLITLATDGEDGPTDAAGALVTPDTVRRALAAGLDPARALAEHDSHALFAGLGDAVRTGPTGTNVCDLALLFRLS